MKMEGVCVLTDGCRLAGIVGEEEICVTSSGAAVIPGLEEDAVVLVTVARHWHCERESRYNTNRAVATKKELRYQGRCCR
jgi:hypothetical protein